MEKKRNDDPPQLTREKAQTTVDSWKLTAKDKRFLRSMNVRPD